MSDNDITTTWTVVYALGNPFSDRIGEMIPEDNETQEEVAPEGVTSCSEDPATNIIQFPGNSLPPTDEPSELGWLKSRLQKYLTLEKYPNFFKRLMTKWGIYSYEKQLVDYLIFLIKVCPRPGKS